MNVDQLTDKLRREVDEKKYLDVGLNVANTLGVSAQKLFAALSRLNAEGYPIFKLSVKQKNAENRTTIKILSIPGVTYYELHRNPDKIQQITT